MGETLRSAPRPRPPARHRGRVVSNPQPVVWQVPDLASPSCATELIVKSRENSDRPLVIDLQGVDRVDSSGAVAFVSNLSYIQATRDLPVRLRVGRQSKLEHVVNPMTFDMFDRNEHPLNGPV